MPRSQPSPSCSAHIAARCSGWILAKLARRPAVPTATADLRSARYRPRHLPGRRPVARTNYSVRCASVACNWMSQERPALNAGFRIIMTAGSTIVVAESTAVRAYRPPHASTVWKCPRRTGDRRRNPARSATGRSWRQHCAAAIAERPFPPPDPKTRRRFACGRHSNKDDRLSSVPAPGCSSLASYRVPLRWRRF